MQNLDLISSLKIRGGYGLVGNQEVPLYQFSSTLINSANYPIDGGTQSGVTSNSIANPDLKWETSKQINVGVDLGFYGDRVTATANYFIKNTEDLITSLPLAGSSGIEVAPLVNSGEIENKGFELEVGYRKSTGDFTYSIAGNGSFLSNEVVSLGGGEEFIYRFPDTDGAALSRITEGQPIYSFFGYQMDGIFQNDSEVTAHATQDGAAPGDIRFKDVSGDGKINEDDIAFLGDPNPDITYGLVGNFGYKNFDLSLFLQGVSGIEIYNGLRYWTEGMNAVSNASEAVLDRWTGDGTSNTVPRAIIGDPSGNRRPSDRFLEDASYLRIKNITIGYGVPSDFLQSLGNGFISKFRVYLTAQNLFTFTSYSGYDPEIGQGFGTDSGEVVNRGVDMGTYPQPRSLIGGIQIAF